MEKWKRRNLPLAAYPHFVILVPILLLLIFFSLWESFWGHPHLFHSFLFKNFKYLIFLHCVTVVSACPGVTRHTSSSVLWISLDFFFPGLFDAAHRLRSFSFLLGRFIGVREGVDWNWIQVCSFFVGTLLQVVILDGVGDNLMMRGGAMGKTVPRKNGQFFFLMFVIFLLLWIASISFFLQNFSKLGSHLSRCWNFLA